MGPSGSGKSSLLYLLSGLRRATKGEVYLDDRAYGKMPEMLLAPFDGVVSAVQVSVGEWAAPGATVVELLNLSRWRIETKNASELQIARVRVGQEVLDFLPIYRPPP